MRFNKWTLGLAAVGAVSLTSVVKAEEQASTVATALSSTTLSGYVDTSAQWNPGSDTQNFAPYAFGGAGKADGFNLNVVMITLEKPLDESEWAAGYRVDLIAGPDAVGYNPASNGDATSDFGVKQAYVALRAPVGNGIDFKMGVFDTIIGYEVFASGSNPNFTRSYGWTIEPTENTGLLASYKVNDILSLSGGVADTLSPGINNRDPIQSRKAYMGSVTLTAPDDFGFLSGSSLYAGVVTGFGGSGGAGAANNKTTQNWYLGTVLNTPVTGLTLGAAFDNVVNLQTTPGFANGSSGLGQDVWTLAGYASYRATEKLSLHARYEYCDGVVVTDKGNYALTGTVQYDLWKNVISRLEARWDHANGTAFGGSTAGTPKSDNAYVLLANIVYKF